MHKTFNSSSHTCSGVVKKGFKEKALKASTSYLAPTPCIAVYVMFKLLDLLLNLKEKTHVQTARIFTTTQLIPDTNILSGYNCLSRQELITQT